MITVCDLEKFCAELAPWNLQLPYDNAGFLLGDPSAPVKKVLLALDITNPVVQEAISCDVQCIISHHPLIFHPLSHLTETPDNRKILRLIENRIAAICLHTNLDIAEGGVNDVLLSLFKAEKLEDLDADHCGRISTLPKAMPLQEFLIECKNVLHTNGLRYYDAGKKVSRIAVMGGAGGSAVKAAVEKGCDTYLTSDLKYHDFILASEWGINLIDGDHFCTENPVMDMLKDRLSAEFPEVIFQMSSEHKQIISFMT